MQQLKLLTLCPLLFLLNACTMLQHGDDPNYTMCKTLQNKITFSDNSSLVSTNPTSTFSQTAVQVNVEQKRLQATYDHLNCSKYQWLKF